MRKLAFSLLGLVVLCMPPAGVRAQRPEYPLILVPTAKGPFTFPPDYQTPWDRIEITVTEKMSPNLYVLHGSPGLDAAHPDASGGAVQMAAVGKAAGREADNVDDEGPIPGTGRNLVPVG